MVGELDATNFSPDVPGVGVFQQVAYPGMLTAGGAVYHLCPAGKTHLRAHLLVIPAVHEPPQRGEPAEEQQLQVAQLPGTEIPAGPFPGLPLDLPGGGLVGEEVHQLIAVGRIEMIVHGSYPTAGKGFSQGRCLDR
jgi:hypothetical protein